MNCSIKKENEKNLHQLLSIIFSCTLQSYVEKWKVKGQWGKPAGKQPLEGCLEIWGRTGGTARLCYENPICNPSFVDKTCDSPKHYESNPKQILKKHTSRIG